MRTAGVGLGVWLLGLLVAGFDGPSMPLWLGVIVVLWSALPIWLAYGHESAIRREHGLSSLIVPRWWHHLLEGHFTRLPIYFAISLWFGVEVVDDLVISGFSAALWIALAMSSTTVLIVWAARWLTNYVPYQRAHRAIRLSVGVIGVLTAILWTIFDGGRGVDAAEYHGTSQVLAELVATAAIWNSLLDSLGQGFPAWGIAILNLVSTAAYYSLAALAGGGVALASSGEWRRLFVHGKELARSVPAKPLFLTSLVLTLIFLFFLAMAATAEQYLLATAPKPDSPSPTESDSLLMRPTQIRAALKKEGVGGLICNLGTKKALEALDQELKTAVRAHSGAISAQIDMTFAEMRRRVPLFLDWYYSLTADYLRTGHLLVGDGSEYLQRQMAGYLTPAAAGTQIREVLHKADLARTDFTVRRTAILARCLSPDKVASVWGDGPIEIVARYDDRNPISDLKALEALLSDGRNFELRAGASGLAGVAAAVVITKFGVSSSAKLATKALVKMVGEKATSVLGGVLAGGAAGGAGGSVVPGAGTGVGAVVGGIVGGVAVWVGVDFLAIKLEEEISRASFQADLIVAINKAQVDVKHALLGP